MILPKMGPFSKPRPGIKPQTVKKDGFNGWMKCSGCSELLYASDLKAHLQCCPKCGYHYRLSLKERIHLLADPSTFTEYFTDIRPVDALDFVDTEPYRARLNAAQDKTKRDDAICVGTCSLEGHAIALGILDFSFMGGSMGSVVGERLTCLIELALQRKLPLIIVSSSGGARMQESVLSLMQMAKTSAALTRLQGANIPYLSILTNPTTGGVTASFATLGDVIIAEPDALIAFAGPRVVEQTIGQKLPKGAQKSEFLLEKGMIDCIVKRPALKKTIASFLNFITGNERDFTDPLAEKMPNRLKELLELAKASRV